MGLAGWLDDEETANAAAAAIGEIGEPHTVFTLLSALQRRPFGEAIVALGRLSDSKAVRPLLFFLADRHGYGYHAAINALAEICEPAVKPLTQALQDDNNDMRMRAAMALGKTGDVRAAKPLLAMWRDRDGDVWAVAANSLGQLRSVAAGAASKAAKSACGRQKDFLERAMGAAEYLAILRSL